MKGILFRSVLLVLVTVMMTGCGGPRDVDSGLSEEAGQGPAPGVQSAPVEQAAPVRSIEGREDALEGLGDPDIRVRWQSVMTLGAMGAPAIPDLIVALDSEYEDVRAVSASVLGEIGPQDDSVIPALIGKLTDTNAGVRIQAARALGSIGPDASIALEELEKLTSDDEPTMVDTARAAIAKIKGE
ncbi:HEAT repeat domain-containing protein [bacterium]|nr:HEAT repeat domain-containing protein [candidate division CSSED10-310 bacterium]